MSSLLTTALWFLIHCKPRQEERALQNLERQSYHCYWPTRSVERVRDCRRTTATEPLFPGYLFIQLNHTTDNWHPIHSTRGVARIVRFNEHPLPVDGRLIDGIRTRLSQNASPEPYLKPGDRVLITEGPFSNLDAIFLAHSGEERVMVLLDILQREHALSFPIRSIRKS